MGGRDVEVDRRIWSRMRAAERAVAECAVEEEEAGGGEVKVDWKEEGKKTMAE